VVSNLNVDKYLLKLFQGVSAGFNLGVYGTLKISFILKYSALAVKYRE